MSTNSTMAEEDLPMSSYENNVVVDRKSSENNQDRVYASERIQIFLNFMVGFILAPWSRGLLYYLIFVIIIEVFYYFYQKDWSFLLRIGMFISSLLGFILGRLFIGYRLPLDDPKTYR